MGATSYNQPEKAFVRQHALQYAIESLTINRSLIGCVERDYVQRLYDILNCETSYELKQELKKIDCSYIRHWESLHDSCIGSKAAKELIVCYLAGPEPKNDFNVLTSLGILPQNIWAFESSKDVYKAALEECADGIYPQPRLIKQSIENFFRNTPKKFDIVYLDACGSVPSTQHALRCVASLSKYHRLASPGVLITNFACPSVIEKDQIECVAEYLFCKRYPNESVANWHQPFSNVKYQALFSNIERNFHEYYGDFITACLCDICAVIMPVQRFVNSGNWESLLLSPSTYHDPQNTMETINAIENCSLWRLSSWQNLRQDSAGNRLVECLWNEFAGDNGYRFNAVQSLQKLFYLKSRPELLKDEIRSGYEKAEDANIFYQFLDRPFGTLYLDFIINQLAYPMHAKTSAIKRFQYCAKETEMFTDIIPLDECRYIYEWLPGIHQIGGAYSDTSWQDVFRFALDGLVKQRIAYNNEFFFRGSVIDKYEDGFEQKELSMREVIERGGVRESA